MSWIQSDSFMFWLILLFDNELLLDEAEYHLKNYGDRGGCYQGDNTLWDYLLFNQNNS